MASLPGNGLQHAVEPLSLLGFTELEATETLAATFGL
jgi:hypothetical protein